MIEAGVNLKKVSEYMGHASITITLDRYGHLLPGDVGSTLAQFDDYLAGRLGRLGSTAESRPASRFLQRSASQILAGSTGVAVRTLSTDTQ
jgi:hypothetical protein